MKYILEDNIFIDYRETPWDKIVMGFSTNEILDIKYKSKSQLIELLDGFENSCKEQGVFFTNIRIDPADRNLRRQLIEHGYNLVETSYEVQKNFDKIKVDDNILKNQFKKRLALESESYVLKNITRKIFNAGRFFEDPFINEEIAIRRNINWIGELLKNEKIVIGESEGTIFGFIAFDLEEHRSNLLLGGVINSFDFFAYPFWNEFFKFTHDQYNTKCFRSVISACNLPALKLYGYFGFNFNKVLLGYHRHRIIDSLNA